MAIVYRRFSVRLFYSFLFCCAALGRGGEEEGDEVSGRREGGRGIGVGGGGEGVGR